MKAGRRIPIPGRASRTGGLSVHVLQSPASYAQEIPSPIVLVSFILGIGWFSRSAKYCGLAWWYAVPPMALVQSGLVVELSDEDLLTRLASTEDNFVERKRFSDDREWLRTVVGFANSCPPNFPGVLFIGAYDNGTIETPRKAVNLDSLQKTLAERLNCAWPAIYYLPKVLRKGGHEFLAVLVPGSPSRPHFAGRSYIRVGSETREASDVEFNELLAQRNSKSFAILQWKGRHITAELRNTENLRVMGPVAGFSEPVVVSCDAYTVKLNTNNSVYTVPLDRILIGHDDERNRLKIEIYPMPI